MTIAALYARVSTDEQAEHGYSIDAQRDACRAFATVRGWAAGQEYVDAGFSGGKSDRPAWQQMIADARAGTFQVLIVHKLDRFSRDVLAGLRVIADLRAAGVSFVSVSEQMDFTTPMGGVMLTMLLAFAQLYREQLRLEVTKGKTQKAKNGRSNANRPPFGYVRVDGRDVIDPPAAELWREAVALAAAGETSDVALADWLNAKGARTPAGKPFTRTAVREMLNNPFYIGLVRWRGLGNSYNPRGDRHRRKRAQTQEYPGEHEPIIDRATWSRLQAVRAKRSGTNRGLPRPQRHQYLLQDLATCSECGGRMFCHTPRSGEQSYMCRASERGETCEQENHRVYERDLVPAIDAMIASLTVPDEVMREAAQLAHIDDAAARTRARQAEIQEEQRRLDAMFRRGRLAEAAWAREIDRLDAELAALTSAPEPEPEGPPLASLLDAWSAGDTAERREVLRALLSEVVIDVPGRRIASWTPHRRWYEMFTTRATLGTPAEIQRHA